MVVAAGETPCVPCGCTAPSVLMDTEVAPVTVQASVELWPCVMEAGVAVNCAMTGKGRGITVTPMVHVSVAPPPEAVSV